MKALLYSQKSAKYRRNIDVATVLGLVVVILIYAVVSLVAHGILLQEEISKLPNTAMGYILELVNGKVGAIIVNIVVIISIFGAWISNTLLAQEVAYQAGVEDL